MKGVHLLYFRCTQVLRGKAHCGGDIGEAGVCFREARHCRVTGMLSRDLKEEACGYLGMAFG